MASATVSARSEPDADLALIRARRWSLTGRILAVNIFAIAMLAGSFFYLDSYRTQLADQRLTDFASDATLIGDALAAAPADARPALATQLGVDDQVRVRIYGTDGAKLVDGWDRGQPTYQLRDPRLEPWRKHAARFMDRAFDAVVGAERLEKFVEPQPDRVQSWPELRDVAAAAQTDSRIRRAPDRTPVVSSAQRLPDRSGFLLVTGSARDITRTVRAQRFALAVVVLVVVIVSVALSLFLARTIVRPLRRLALAAHRVRLGRAREVVVPRLPRRRDEIGMLARALSDMSQALRTRIDAVETFAADVSHELKNPLASLRSALDSLDRVSDPALRAQLLALMHDDVRRLDRLVTDVAEVSRLDAELTRTRFERVDLGALIEALLAAREERGRNRDVRVAFARPFAATTVVMGDGERLARAFENLVDNAVSFSPSGGLVEVGVVRIGDDVRITVDDEGRGVPANTREMIFRRFYSERPDGEAFGRHSGLGLAIVKTIVEGHGGRIGVDDRADGASGARFVIHLAAADPDEPDGDPGVAAGFTR
ncbi:MAG: sensor N-terminal transmembrane domain-containing protein [Sphingomonadaceae bacterium]|nr:sensor N-terminal transmembrane domain-containing protein [Sphingomonadaceae bacterium]